MASYGFRRRLQISLRHNLRRHISSACAPTSTSGTTGPRIQLFTKSRIVDIFSRYCPHIEPEPFYIAAQVFPMRANNYVLENLIDWSKVPEDPIFQLVFPQPEMLSPEDFAKVRDAVMDPHHSKVALRDIAEGIRAALNPHPAGQQSDNVPLFNGKRMKGMQHKYQSTVLFFPMEGQYCHSYCTYCFRWAQFTSVGSDQQIRSTESQVLKQYVMGHPQVRDVLFTGGDPMVMPASILRRYIQPLLDKSLESLHTIRIGSKSLAYWPWRFVTDPDSKQILDLFSEVIRSGRQLAFQAHFSHPQELETPVVQEAIRLIRSTGAQIRCQAPLIRRVNDHPAVWNQMWNMQTRLGMIPYYMFVERDTGPKNYFSVPLEKAYQIFSEAYSRLVGTARGVRGPSMSASPGKVGIVGIEELLGEKVFALKFYQARNPEWTKRLFFAKFDPEALWLDDLKPAFGEPEFFYEREFRELLGRCCEGSSGQMAWKDNDKLDIHIPTNSS